MKKVLIALLCVFACMKVQGQQVFVIDHIEMADDKVIIFYNLNDDNSSHQYNVQLFSSQDNFTVALTKVSGDVGTEVRPGAGKKIIWDATKEVGNFSGNVSFEVRGRIYVPFVKLKDLNEGQVFKRGKNYPITWTSGNMSGQVNIELYKGDVRISGDNNQPNVGKYDWYVPSGAKKGDDYKLKFTNTKDRSDVVYSLPFVIKPKVPFLLKAVGVAVIGGAIFVLSGGKGSTTTSNVPSDLPALTQLHP